MEQLSQNKELEALKDIERVCRDSNYQYAYYKERLSIIENTLKRIPELEKEIADTHEAYTMAIEKHIKDENDYIEWVQEGGYDKTKVQAFDIIKRNPVMIICEIYKCAIELKMSYEEYCDYFSKDEKSIKSKEEYDLLKEALKNDD